MFGKLQFRKNKKDENQTSPEVVFMEVHAAFTKEIIELSKILQWKKETVIGLIVNEASKNWYWRGYTPFEISQQLHYWFTRFKFDSLKQCREEFLSNIYSN